MRNVDQMASPQPPAYAAHTTPAAGPVSSHTVPSIGCQSQNTSTRARFAARTNVARSAGGGTMRVQWRLNHGRAITVCWTANSSRSSTSIPTASGTEARGPSSIALGTPKPAKNPTA